MQIVPFSADHIIDLMETIQPAQAQDLEAMLSNDSLDAFVQLERGVGMSYTMLGDDGSVIASGGVFTIWPQRAQAWAMVSSDFARKGDLRRAVRFVRSILDTYPAVRIEATVLCEFDEGHHFARVLGFEMEAERLRRYDPAGRDFALYARIRE